MSADEEFPSDYIEDPYFSLQNTNTPSLDEVDHDNNILDDFDILENDIPIFDLRQLEFDETNATSLTSLPDDDESVNVETEFINVQKNILERVVLRKKDFRKLVRVTYSDLSKPVSARMPKGSTYKQFLDFSVYEKDEAAALGDAPDLSHLSAEEREEQEKAWREELAQVEDEIATLRTVLAAKVKLSSELKRNLGITVWKEVSDDINQGLKNVKESNVYQSVETKVGQVTKAVTDAPIYQKTTSLIGGITGNISNKIGAMRHSESFRSIEEKVGSAYENVKTKVVSRSSSQQSLDDISRSRSGSVVTSPTIPEEKNVA